MAALRMQIHILPAPWSWTVATARPSAVLVPGAGPRSASGFFGRSNFHEIIRQRRHHQYVRATGKRRGAVPLR